jgi:coenzyme F420-reducing hydrogenase gamma subunit
MNPNIAISRKLEQVSDLVAEIKELMNQRPEKATNARREYLVEADLVAQSYPKEEPCTRWITCAQACTEMGIEPTRGACSSVGATLSRLGFKSRRSNGKTLVFVPPIFEAF